MIENKTLEELIKVDKTTTTSVTSYEFKTVFLNKNSNYDISVVLFNGPFANCQNFTVRMFSKIILHCETYEDFKIILNYFKYLFGRKILVADINNSVYDKLIVLIGNSKNIEDLFLVNSKYTSTNGSQMVCLMINIPKL